MTTSSYAAVHVDVDGHVTDPLYVDYNDGRVGIKVAGATIRGVGVWLSGTPDELHAFASEIHRHTNRAARELLRVPTRDVEPDPIVLPAAEDAA